ncbi:MAG: transglycosylase domain-containing protein, partial [Erysipelotrichaceae bacterium]|nr:transglycosylase domain-containing protein [Erysipelotrichaceae bacterium]
LLGGFYLYKRGEALYEKTIAEKPLKVAVSEVMASDQYIPYEQISPYFVDALVSIEDRRFFERLGVDYYSIVRALIANLNSQKIVEGGSTITQQLAKNMYFTHEALIDRKVAEIFFVRDLENSYSKEEIFALYASVIYYGDGYYGVKKASLGYYGKAASELDLYQSSLLAGLPQAPSIYQLSTGLSKAKERQKLVLKAMVANKCISEEEMNAVLNEFRE